MVLFMYLLVGIAELSFTHLKKKKRKKVNNSPNGKQRWQEHHQISALHWNTKRQNTGDFQGDKSSIKKVTTTGYSYHCHKMDILKGDYKFASEILLSRIH